MQRGYLLTVLLLTGVALGAGVVSATGEPLVEAGLDQEVRQGATVYLDAGGSVAPDGQIESYHWEITTPNGSTETPVCQSCVQTRFRARQNGTYTVTVTATDSEGRNNSDTIYVTSVASEPPSVTLSGPPNPGTEESYTYEASVTAGDLSLGQLRWEQNQTVVGTTALKDDQTTIQRNLSFDTPGQTEISVTVLDSTGQTDEATQRVFVENASKSTQTLSEPVSSESASSSTSTSGSSSDAHGFYEEIERFNTNDGPMFTFNFLNDDQLASNKNGGKSGLGADYGGMGVKKQTLNRISQNNPDVVLSDESYGETTFTMTGDVAHNFIDSDDTVTTGVRVGTTDIVTIDELIRTDTSTTDTNKNKESILSNAQDSHGTNEPDTDRERTSGSNSDRSDNNQQENHDSDQLGSHQQDNVASNSGVTDNSKSQDTVATSRHDSVFNSVDGSSSEDESTDSSGSDTDDSVATNRHDSVFNSAESSSSETSDGDSESEQTDSSTSSESESDNSVTQSRHDSIFNSIVDSVTGNSRADSDNDGEDTSGRTSESEEDTSQSDSDDENTDSTGNDGETEKEGGSSSSSSDHGCDPGEFWYASLGCW